MPEVGLDDPWPHLHLPECLDPPRSKEAHAWAIRSDWSWSASLEKHGSILSNDELARASKFLSPKDRDEYVLAHAMLRTILARYLGREPKDIPLIKTEHGKPTCRDRADLSFSLAHAQGAVLIAVTIGCEVGVDVEQVRPMPDATDLVRRYFSPREMRRFLATEEPERDRAFFRLWTRKEAYLKALGLGLSEPLDSFDVTFGADEPVRVQRGRSGPWSLFHLEPFPTFVGALAVRGEVGRLAGGVIYPTPERVPS